MTKVTQRLHDWLWDSSHASKPLWIRGPIVLLRYALGLSRDLVGGQLSLHAMGLVYSTLLATVPLIAFSFSVLRGLNLHLELAPLLNEFLAPLGDQGRALTENVLGMVNNVRGTVLGGLSLAAFLYTAISMVQKVEASFNFVWHVGKPRSLSRRIVDYAAVLLVAPLVMTLAFTTLASLRNSAVLQAVSDSAVFGPVTVGISKVLPVLLVVALFTALYKWLPNARVDWRAALVGGATAGSLWALCGIFFAEFVASSSRTLVIYASFAIAILTLIWLYVNWLVLLLGARIAFYFQNRAYLSIGEDDPTMPNATRERLALELMRAAAVAFKRSSAPITLRALSEQIGVAGIYLQSVANELEAAGLLLTSTESHLKPARDIHEMTLADVLAAVRAGESDLVVTPSWSSATSTLSAAIDDQILACTGNVTVADWVSESATPEVSSPQSS
ncbi:MAG: YihY/virulence factor BrkB family protein [Pseudomonadota bacterium]